MNSSQPSPSLTTGIFFDSRCLLHQCNYQHVEGPTRLIRSYEYLIRSELFNQCKLLQVEGCSVLDTFQAVDNNLQAVDDPNSITNAPINSTLYKHLYGTTIPLNYDPTITNDLITTMNAAIDNNNNNNNNNNDNNPQCPNNPRNNNVTDNNNPNLTSFAVHQGFKRHITPNFPSPITPTSTTTPRVIPTLLHKTPSKLIPNHIVERIHHNNLIQLIEGTADLEYGEDELDSETEGDDTLYPDCAFITSDTYVNRYSSIAARTAVTGCVELTRAICNNEISNAVAIIRPPGHHAGLPLGTPINFETSPDNIQFIDIHSTHVTTNNNNNNNSNSNIDSNNTDNITHSDTNNNNNTHTNINVQDIIDTNSSNIDFSKQIGVEGFCLYNNIAIAAQTALIEYPDNIKRVVIIDFDIHHGNGTQSIFIEQNNVLFISIHRFAETFFPESGWFNEIGTNDGEGYSLNIPIETTNIRNIDFLMIFATIIFPILSSYQPDIIFVSAGMDCLRGDPVGNMKFLTDDIIYHIIYALSQFKFSNFQDKGECNVDSSHDINTANVNVNNYTKQILTQNKILVALEGGYNDHVVGAGIQTIVQALLDSKDASNDDTSSHPRSILPLITRPLYTPTISNSINDVNNNDNIDDNVEQDQINFDIDNDSDDIYQFYKTLHATIEYLAQFWPVLYQNNHSFVQLFSKIQQFDSSSQSLSLQTHDQILLTLDELKLDQVKYKVEPNWSPKIKNADSFVQNCINSSFLTEIWSNSLKFYCMSANESK